MSETADSIAGIPVGMRLCISALREVGKLSMILSASLSAAEITLAGMTAPSIVTYLFSGAAKPPRARDEAISA